MALSTTTRKITHNGNGSATVFGYSFPILADSHLSVIYTDADDVETTLSPSEYTATGIGTVAGGNVTYTRSGAAIAVGTKLTIVRTVPYTQLTVLSNQGGYYPEVVEARFDLIYMALQQLDEIVGRYTVSSISDPATEQSNYALIQALQSDLGDFDKLTAAGDVLTHNGAAYVRLPRGTAGQFLGINGTALQWQTPSSASFSGVRQTVSAGPVTTAGLPDLLGTNPGALSLTTSNVSASYPLVATAASGWSASTGAPVDTIGYRTTALQWTGLTANKAAATPNFLYVTISGGALTAGSTILPPIYQWGGTPSTTNGQFTFNISEMRGYLGNGSTAPQTDLVFVGEAATDGTGVISSVCYAYNGRYESIFTALPVSSTVVTGNHNIGCTPTQFDVLLQNTTTDSGYPVGSVVSLSRNFTDNDGVNQRPLPMPVTEKTIRMIASSGWNGFNYGRSAGFAITLASWSYKFVAERGW